MKRSGASIILQNSRNKVLLFLRDDKPDIPYPNFWDLPGGHVEKGETPEACIVREMMEEIETDISACSHQSVYNFDDRIEYLFFMDFEAETDTIPLYEGQRLQWFAETEIPWNRLAYGFDLVLRDFFTGCERRNDDSKTHS